MTSPEELIAAAHSTCFSMALSNELSKAGHTVESIDTRADVDFQPGQGITGIQLTTRARGRGISQRGVRRGRRGAKRGLPGQPGPHRHHDHPGRHPRLRTDVPVVPGGGESVRSRPSSRTAPGHSPGGSAEPGPDGSVRRAREGARLQRAGGAGEDRGRDANALAVERLLDPLPQLALRQPKCSFGAALDHDPDGDRGRR